MATVGDGRASYESGGAEENIRKRPFRTENNEELQNVSQEAGRNNSTGVSYQGGGISSITWILELGQMLKQKTFTRSEAEWLIALVHSRTIEEESPSSLLRLEPSTSSNSLKKRKFGDESDNFHAAVVSSRVRDEIVSPADLSDAFKDSSVITGFQKQDIKLIHNNPTCLPNISMPSLKHPATMEDLPEELLVNIFMRLFAKQLAQMRSISKSWNAILSQSSFIKSHLNRSIYNNDQVFLYFRGDESSSGFEPFTAHPSQSLHFHRTSSIKLPDNPQPQSDYNGIRVIGSVNGLICSTYDDVVIHIWNPSLSAMVTLPPYSMPSDDFDPLRIFLRFGYDSKTDDYKVLKLTGLLRGFKNVVKWWLQVEMYSMRKGTWQLITDRVPSHLRLILDDNRTCVDGHNGHLHWVGYISDDRDSKTILAFDMGSETFREMSLPHSTLDETERVNFLGVLAGKLCWMSWVDGICEVLVMEEYGVVESWVKRHAVPHFIGHNYTFGFTLHNEFFLEDRDGSLVFYDPIADKTTIVEDYCLEEYERYQGKFVEYVDSLVWVAPAKHEMVDGVEQN